MTANSVNLGLGLDGLEKSMRRQKEEEPAPEGSERSKFIGGSDAAAVCNMSPWATQLDIYFKKTGTHPPTGAWRDQGKEKMFRRGKRAEPHAIDMAIEDLGIKVTKRSTPTEKNYHLDPEHPFLAAEIDFEWEVTPEVAARYELPDDLVGTIQNGEVKSVHPFAAGKFGEEETDEIPVEYGIQGMHGLMVTGRKLTMFLVLTGWDDLSIYWIRRDDTIIANLRKVEVKFWNENVLAGVPPDPVNLPDVYHLFKRMGETKIAATPEIEAMVVELARCRAEAKKVEAQVEDVQFKLGVAVLGATVLENPDHPGKHVVHKGSADILVIDFQQQYRLNEDKLKALYPDVAEECAKIIQFFVYRLPKAKKDPAEKKSQKSKKEPE